MKSKLFKKIIAAAATVAMAAQLAVVLPASAATIYSEDYETSENGEEWTVTGGSLALGTDATKYISLTQGGGSGARRIHSDLTEANIDVSDKTDGYVVEFDLAFKQSTSYAGTQFAVVTGSFPSGNNGVAADQALFHMEAGTSAKAALAGVSSNTVEFPRDTWCHYVLYVKPDENKGSLTITNKTDDSVVLDKRVVPVPSGVTKIKGLNALMARGDSAFKFDNFVVRDAENTDEFGEIPDEVLNSVVFTSQINQSISQPAEGEPVQLPITIKATGSFNSDLTNDPNTKIEWSVMGLDNEDGYISLTKEPGTGYGTEGVDPDGATAYFNVRNGVSNWFGKVSATVTYNDGDPITLSTPFAVIGASGGGNNLAPKQGYFEDMSDYDDSLVGYVGMSTGETTQDLVLNNWSIYGSNGARSFDLEMDEDGTKYLRFKSNGGGGSTVGVYQLANQSSQYIIDMTVRMPESKMSFGHYENTSNNGHANSSWTVSYNSGNLVVGTQSIEGLNKDDWFRIVISADESAGTYWAKVYKDGAFVGETDPEPLNQSNAKKKEGQNFVDISPSEKSYTRDQRYLCLDGYPVDLAKFKVYYPTPKELTIDAPDTIQVPESGASDFETVCTTTLNDMDGYIMSGKAKLELEEEYTGVAIDEDTGKITVTDEAGSGTIILIASYGSVRTEKEIRLSTTGNSITFTKSTSSLTIPFSGESAVTASYEAEARNREGNKIEGSTVTYSLIDASGNAITNLKGVTFDAATGVLTVAPGAAAKTVYIKAESTVAAGEETENLSAKAKVNIHGLSFAFGTSEPSDEGYTQTTSANAYTDKAGYGFADTSKVTDSATAVIGTDDFTFKAKVPNGNYVVTLDAADVTSIKSEVVEGISATTGIGKSGSTFKVAVCDGVLDLTFSSGASLKALSIAQDAAKTTLTKPAVYAIGDSTTKNDASGAKSWGNCVGGGVTVPDNFSGFNNHGMAGRDSVNYYNEGRVEAVLLSVCPGDYVTVNMGINSKESGEPASYYTLLSEYYVEGILQRGGIPVIVTATPLGFSDKQYPYDSASGKFTVGRSDSAHNPDLRDIAEKKDLNIIELGQHFEDLFNSYTMDDVTAYNTENGTSFESVLDMVKSWSVDHNHYKEYLGNMIGTYIFDELADIEENPFDLTSVTNQASDGKLTLTATAKENTAKGSKTLDVYVAQYDADGRLVTVSKQSATFKNSTLTAELDYAKDAGAASVKVFAWDGMKPYMADTDLHEVAE